MFEKSNSTTDNRAAISAPAYTRRSMLQGLGVLAAASTTLGVSGAETTTGFSATAGASDRSLLIKNIPTLVTMDDQRREIRGGAMRIRGNVVEAVGTTTELSAGADEVLDLRGRYIVMPGMVNTHHHFYQTLTRVVKPDGTLFPWLKALYPIWANMRSEDIYLSAQLAAAELLLSGCTTSSDHLYILPNDCRIDDEIRALEES